MNAIQFLAETKTDVSCLEHALSRYSSVLSTSEKKRMKEQIESLKRLLPKES